MQIEWTDDLSVGVESIDEQHKQLVSITNKLFQAILDDKGKTIVMEVLDELRQYIDHHFSYEEELLQRYAYPTKRLVEHIAEHRALSQQVQTFITGIEKSESLDLEVFDFLRDWTTEHLNTTDRQYADYLCTCGAQ